jgi:hypothetical protein
MKEKNNNQEHNDFDICEGIAPFFLNYIRTTSLKVCQK